MIMMRIWDTLFEKETLWACNKETVSLVKNVYFVDEESPLKTAKTGIFKQMNYY